MTPDPILEEAEDEMFAAAATKIAIDDVPPETRPPVKNDAGFVLPERLANLPVSRQLQQIDFTKRNIVVIAQTGAGKSMILPCVEAMQAKAQGRSVQFWFRQPTRVACRFIYSGLKKFWGPLGLKVGIQTSDEKEGVDDADIVIFSDGSLKSVLGRSGKDIVVYFDEIHNVGTVATEIEISLCKKLKIPMRLLSATIDPKVFMDYLGPQTGLYYLDGRTFPINKSVRNVDVTTFFRDNPEAFHECIEECVAEVLLDEERALFFVPTKAMAEELCARYADQIATKFAHGEVSPADLEKWVNENSDKPFVIFCTLVAATSITVDVGRVYIWDQRVNSEMREGIIQSYACRPENNLLLQMAGRAGRIREGTAMLITTTVPEEANHGWHKPRSWGDVTPEPPIMPAARETPYKLKLSLAEHGIVRDEDIDLLSKIDQEELDHAHKWLRRHGCLDVNGELTKVGEWLERLPVDAPLGHLIVTAPSRAARVALAAAITVNVKGAYQITHLKPGSAQLRDARMRLWNERKDSGMTPDQLLPLLPRECVIQGSMPLTMAHLLQRAYKARDRQNHSETMPAWCGKNNVNYKVMSLIQRDFEKLIKTLSVTKEEFMEIDFTDKEFCDSVTRHVCNHDLLTYIEWPPGEEWSRWRGMGAVIDSVSVEIFGVRKGTQRAAVGLPKIIKSKRGIKFVSLDFPTMVPLKEEM